MAFASLLLELALTRLFSVILFYHFAFFAISIALLGLGAGGVFAYLWKLRLARFSTHTLGVAVGLSNAILLLVVLVVDLRQPVPLEITRSAVARLTVIYLTSALPFFLIGLFFSVVFARETRRITQLYSGDLVGAASACLAVVPLLNLVGGPGTVIMAAALMAVSAAVWAESRRLRVIALVLGVALAGLAIANRTGRFFDIVYAKGIRRDPRSVLYARWNAISRVEVHAGENRRSVVIDADAASEIMRDDPQRVSPETRRDWLSGSSSAATAIRPRGTYAIIGPGGGVDVLGALAAGSPHVTGIEINPIIVNDVMRDRYLEYSHHLYDRPNVRIHVSDGRSWIRSSRQQFDVLQMTLVDTWASTAAGAFALSENNLYTVEAFKDYFDHLRPDGFLAITRWEFEQPREALRVISVAIEALRRIGIAGAVDRHFLVVSDGPLNVQGRTVTVLAKKSPFTLEEEAALRRHLADHPRLMLLYSPSDAVSGARSSPNTETFKALIASGNGYEFARSYRFNVAPVTDDAPFFFFTLKPAQVWGSRGDHGIDWKVNMGVMVLLVVLGVSALAVVGFLVLPLALRRGARAADPKRLLYFVALGLGYIFVEIALIQRFVLFLGHPVYALTVVIFLMLLSSGMGSLLSRRWLPDPTRVGIPLLAIVVALGTYLWLMPPLLRVLIGMPFAPKLLLSASLLIPIGFLMGMPFPAGLRAMAGADRSLGPGVREDNFIEWAWAMNAAASVLGSVLVMIIAIQFGITMALAGGTAAYLVATLLRPRAGRS